MGLTITLQHRAITLDRKELTASLFPPSKQDLPLELLGYFHIWIPNFSVLAHAPKGPLTEPLDSTTNSPYFNKLLFWCLLSLGPLQTFQLMKAKCQTQPCHSHPFLTKISHSCREILDFKKAISQIWISLYLILITLGLLMLAPVPIAVVSLNGVVESESLPEGTTSQKTELITLNGHR